MQRVSQSPRVSAGRNPAFGVITSAPLPAIGAPGSGGRANVSAYASLPLKYRPLTNAKTSPRATPPSLLKRTARSNVARGRQHDLRARPVAVCRRQKEHTPGRLRMIRVIRGLARNLLRVLRDPNPRPRPRVPRVPRVPRPFWLLPRPRATMPARGRPFPLVDLGLCHVCPAARGGRLSLARPVDLLLGAGRQSRARPRVRPRRRARDVHRATLSCVSRRPQRVTAGNPIAIGLFQAAIGAIGGVALAVRRPAGDVRVDVLRGGNLRGLCWFRAGSDGRADFVDSGV